MDCAISSDYLFWYSLMHKQCSLLSLYWDLPFLKQRLKLKLTSCVNGSKVCYSPRQKQGIYSRKVKVNKQPGLSANQDFLNLWFKFQHEDIPASKSYSTSTKILNPSNSVLQYSSPLCCSIPILLLSLLRHTGQISTPRFISMEVGSSFY